MKAASVIPEHSYSAEFQEFMASMREVKERNKETSLILKDVAKRQKETERIIKENAKQQAERQKETARQMKETDRQIKEYNRRFGDFTNRFGEVVEHMVAPNLREKFLELGLDFPEIHTNTNVKDHKNQIFLELDAFLENGDKAMLVEIKTKLTIAHVKEHIKRLEKMRVYADLRGDKRAFLGAAAGVVMTEQTKAYALGQGLYVVQPSGETFNITCPNGNPKEW